MAGGEERGRARDGEGETGPMRLSRLAGWCGVAGPVLFTVAWLAGSLRQSGHSMAEVQLSGLAADDARDPQIMMAGFVALGVCSIGFGGRCGGGVPARSPVADRPGVRR